MLNIPEMIVSTGVLHTQSLWALILLSVHWYLKS